MLRGMGAPDVAGFLARFTAFGAAPGVETYLPLFHPEATLFDAGMEHPIGLAEIPAHLEAILKLVPDFTMVPERWRERGGTLFVEARNEATLGRAPARWPSVYCVDLVGDRVVRGRRYYDRQPRFARLDPATPALPAAPVGRHDLRGLALLVPELGLDLRSWAGDDTLLFLEWQAHGRLGGAPFAVGVAERLELAGGRVTDAHSYFDTLALAARVAAAG